MVSIGNAESGNHTMRHSEKFNLNRILFTIRFLVCLYEFYLCKNDAKILSVKLYLMYFMFTRLC